MPRGGMIGRHPAVLRKDMATFAIDVTEAVHERQRIAGLRDEQPPRAAAICRSYRPE